MSQSAVLAPVLAQVALTFALATWLGLARLAAVRSGAARIKDTALGQPAWPDRVLQIGNSFANQFEMPVLFFVLVALLLITGTADRLMVGLAWAFVATRAVHAFIHTTSNRVSRRFLAFLAGVVILGLMWVIFALRILMAGF